MTNKYELQKGEEYIDEYIDDDGTTVTILKDKNGDIKHGWNIEIDADIYAYFVKTAKIKGMDTQDYIDECMESTILLIIKEAEIRQAIEDISD